MNEIGLNDSKSEISERKINDKIDLTFDPRLSAQLPRQVVDR